jgi:hypothetical protein
VTSAATKAVAPRVASLLVRIVVIVVSSDHALERALPNGCSECIPSKLFGGEPVASERHELTGRGQI